MSGKYNQIPIGSHRIKISEDFSILESDINFNIIDLFMKDLGNIEENLKAAAERIKDFEGTYKLEQSKNKVYWNVEKMMCTLKPMFTEIQNVVYIKIYKEG